MVWTQNELRDAVEYSVNRYHQSIGLISGEEAIKRIREGRAKYINRVRKCYRVGCHTWKLWTYTNILSFHMIDRIKENPDKDPVRTIVEFIYDIEQVSVESGNSGTYIFTGYIRIAASYLLDFLNGSGDFRSDLDIKRAVNPLNQIY